MLDKKSPSNRAHVFVLNLETNVFMDIKISSPKEVKDEYEKVFVNYKKLIPKGFNFVSCLPQENENENDNGIVILDQHNSPEEIQHLSMDSNSLGNEHMKGACSKNVEM